VIAHTIDHLVCYRIHERGAKDIKESDEDIEDRRDGGKERREVSVENQFGEQHLEVKKPRLLCVPSLKTLR